MDEDLQEMIAGFVEDSREAFDSMEEDLMAMEDNPDDPAIMNNLFRVMHTLKGTAGFMGLGDISSLAHKLESVFDLVRQNKMGMTAQLIDFLLPSIDMLKALVFALVGEGEAPDIASTVATLIKIVESGSDAVLGGGGGAAKAAAPKAAPVVEAPKVEAPPKSLAPAEPVKIGDAETFDFDAIMAQFGENVPVPGQETTAAPEAPAAPTTTPAQDAGIANGQILIAQDQRANNSLELVRQFVIEAEEHLETIEESLLALEENPSAKETIDSFFRAIHSIKGTAAYVNIKPIEILGHKIESVFDNMRKGTLAYTKEIGDVVFKSIDMLRTMVFYVKIEDFNQIIDYSDQYNLLTAIVSGDKVPTKVATDGGAKENESDKLSAFLNNARQQTDVLNLFGGELKKGPLDEHSLITLHRALKTLSMGAKYCDLNTLEKAITDYEEFLLKILGGETEQSELMLNDVLIPLHETVIKELQNAQTVKPKAATPAPAKAAPAPAKAAPPPPPPKKEAAPAPKPAEAPKAAEAPKPKAAPPPKAASKDEDDEDHDEKPVSKAAAPPPAPAGGGGPLAKKISNKPEDKKDAEAAANAEAKTMRVDASRLDRFMNLIGELIIARNAFKHLAESIDGTQSVNDLIQDIKQIENNISRISDNLQDNLMEMRLVQVKTVFQRMPRIVRDIARKTNKKINLQMIGENTEVDKSIVEEIGDPLVHIIRNSCDHGVEPPEQRIAAGKPETGTITLKAGHMGSFIAIDIIDDGRGVNPEIVKRVAVKKGVITQEESDRMSEEQAVALIFAPGFSTAEQVTDISGRGVGMDVVMTNIRNIQGTVEVTSKLNQGTMVRLKLPLTLAVIEALIVGVGKYQFAIPLDAIKETVQISYSAIKRLKDKLALELRGEILGVTPLTELLLLESEEIADDEEREDLTKDKKLAIVVLQVNNKEIGIAVDRLYNQQEIVVKPLEDYISNIPGLKGSTIMGDGQVVLILEPNELMELATSI